jgi:hypothetical protein
MREPVEIPTAELPPPPIVPGDGGRRAAQAAQERETALAGDAARATQLEAESQTALRTEGQRATSGVWENTQMKLAILAFGGFMVSHTFIVVAIGIVLVTQWRSLVESPAGLAALVAVLAATNAAISSMAAVVTVAYFQRTNSHKVGGVDKDYVGR